MLSAYFCAAITATFALNSAALAAPEHKGEPLLCVLVPHFKDEYWLSVAYGIEGRAATAGLAVGFFEAGGYHALDRQITQLRDCMALQPAAVLIGAVSADAPQLLAAVASAAQTSPVIGLVNELRSPALSARVGVDWTEMGFVLGRHLAGRYPPGGPPRQAVLLTGPVESGWVAPHGQGLRAGLQNTSLQIAAVYGADTGTAEQLRLVERALEDHPDIDLIIGPAPAIEAAMGWLADRDTAPDLAATYVSHSVARGLAGGKVQAAPFDNPILQGQLSVDAALTAIAGQSQPGLTGPAIRVLEAGASASEMPLSPAGYFPTLH